MYITFENAFLNCQGSVIDYAMLITTPHITSRGLFSFINKISVKNKINDFFSEKKNVVICLLFKNKNNK